MRIAVIGSTGFIGYHVAQRLTAAGHEVIGIQRGSPTVRVPAWPTLAADRQDSGALSQALERAAPTAVVDMVAYTAEETDALTAVLPTTTARLTIISSGDVYRTYDAFRGRTEPAGASEPVSENGPLRDRLFPYRSQARDPRDMLYRYEKILVEQRARAAPGIAVTVLRLPMVYGPGDPQHRVSGYLKRFQTDAAPLSVNADEAGWRCTRGYVEDVASAVALAATDERAAGQVYNVGEADALTELEWLRAIARAAGWEGEVVADRSAPASLQANWSVSLAVDTRRIREHLGYTEPVGRTEGLRRTVRTATSE